MRLVLIEHRATVRKCARKIAAAGNWHVAIMFSMPHKDRDLDHAEIETPWAGNQPHVSRRPAITLPAGFFKAGHKPVADLGALQQDSIRLRRPGRHPFAGARTATLHGELIEPEQTAEEQRSEATETEHHAQRAAQRIEHARSVGRGNAPEHTNHPDLIRHKRTTGGRIRRAAGGAEDRECAQSESGSQVVHIGGPIHDAAARLILGVSHSRAVRYNHAQAERRRDRTTDDQVTFYP